MGLFGWIIFVLIVAPVCIGVFSGLSSGIFKVSDDTENYSSKRIIIEFVIAAVLLIWAVIDIFNGIFSSLFTASFFLIKILACVYLLLLGIKHTVVNSHQDSWSERINSSLNGPLGRDIKKHLYNNSNEYAVYNNRIIFDKNGTSYRLDFSDLGYNEIPASSSDAVCEWIRRNVVANPDMYYIQRENKEETDYSDYTEGSPDTYSVTKNYSGGYDVEHHAGTSGSFGTKTVTVCYKLVKRRNRPTSHRELKDW